MGDFEADTLRDSIESGWALTGALAKTTTTIMKNPVKFFAHPQVKQIQTKKAIQVAKITPVSSDVIHAKFTEVRNVFEIKCRYTVEDVKNSKWDTSEQRVEDMCNEVVRIVKTVYNPNGGTGDFYVSNGGWINNDELNTQSQVLIRTMNLTLTRIKSETTTVFKGYGGVLAFDTSESGGDDLPASDYTYTEAFDVQWAGGFPQIVEYIDGTTSTDRQGVYFTGGYKGRFNCMMNVKKADWTNSGTEQFPAIGNLMTTGETPEVVFTWVVTDSASNTLTATITLKVISIDPTHNLEDLSKFKLIAEVIKPPTYALT